MMLRITGGRADYVLGTLWFDWIQFNLARLVALVLLSFVFPKTDGFYSGVKSSSSDSHSLSVLAGG